MRMFHGVDLDKNYASQMWNTYNTDWKRRIALKRQFRGYCLRLEREMKTGMFVIDREKRIYQIIDCKGWGIEDKEYWLQRFTTHNIEKKTALEIYHLEWWQKERTGNLAAGERMPLWFRIVDEILKREGEENDGKLC